MRAPMMPSSTQSMLGCPTLAAFLFLRLGWINQTPCPIHFASFVKWVGTDGSPHPAVYLWFRLRWDAAIAP